MSKRLLTIFVFLISNICYSQNIHETQQNIKSSVEAFFSYISGINDPVEQFPINTIVDIYGSRGNYFYYNEQSTSLQNFLRSYIENQLKTRLITHELSNLQISKVNDSTNDKRYKVEGILKRYSATGEDIVIKDENLSMVILWDNQCSILEINLTPSLKITHPKTKYEYTLEVDRSHSQNYISYAGGNWNLSINSSRQTIKEYEGYPRMTAIIKKEPWEYEISSCDIKHKRNGNTIEGELGPNISKDRRTYSINLIQKTSGKTTTAFIEQSAKNKITFADLFSVWDIPIHNFSIGYSLKYQMGISYMYSFEDTRFSLGALMHVNFNSFKNWNLDSYLYNNSSSSTTIIINGEVISSDSYTYESNGYEVTVNKVKPSKEYSPLFDPHNTAHAYTSRSLYMFQSGIYLNDWIRLEFGLGAAAYKNKIHVDDVYKYELYSYKPLTQDCTPIDDIYSFSWYESNYIFSGKYKWNFALRTGVNCCIPLDHFDEYYLNVGIGYVIVPNEKSCNSLDFQLGFGWYF